MQTGYEDIDNLNNQASQLYDEQMKQQQNIINTSTQQTIDEIERNKKKAEEEALKTNKALYTDYQKQINPYGVNAENMAEQGLAGSGVSESAKTSYYNTYQNARTEAQNNANTIKADFDAQITQARQNGDLQLAQSALEMYQQKIQDLYNTYNLKFNQEQFNYQKEQDALTQSNWEKEYNQAVQQAQWEQQFNQAQFDYQKEQDALAQSNWEKEFALAKKSYSSSSKIGNYLDINEDEGDGNDNNETENEGSNEFVNNATAQILNLKKVASNSTSEATKTRASELLEKMKEAIDLQYSRGVITRKQVDSLFEKIG